MSGNAAWRVLIADPVAREGVEALQADTQVDVRTGLAPDELLSIIGEYDALVVRSETRVTADVIAGGRRLQVVGRAGVGVDNIDIPAATDRGIVVVNAPTGNTVSAAEHTIGLMLALARHIPQAHASLKAGEWKRGKFVGVELRGKVLGLIGLGQVGSEVARRGRGLEMRVVAHDPFVPEDRARALGVTLVDLATLLHESDFIALHTTLTQGTRGLIGDEEIAQMKPTVRIINTARGGIIDEETLYRALEDGRVAGAAVDVFSKEPATDNVLMKSDKVVVTPHLGASTAEAQERVALDVAEQVLAVLRGEPVRYAVNAPLVAPEAAAVLGPYLDVATTVGMIATQLQDGQLGDIEIEYTGELAQHDTTVLRAAVIRGLMRPISEENITVVNADLVAERRGLRIAERRDPSAPDGIPNLLAVTVRTRGGQTRISGTIERGQVHLVDINELLVDMTPDAPYLLVCDNQDRPGMIAGVGSKMQEFDINISSMKVGRREPRGRALMVLGLDEAPTEEQLREVEAIPDIYSARLVRL